MRLSAVQALAQLDAVDVASTLRRALADPDQGIRRTAARALASRGGQDAAAVFTFALDQPLLVRALLAEALQRHAAALCSRAVPQALAHEHRARVLATLDIVWAWRRCVDLPVLDTLCQSKDGEIAAAAVRLLPYLRDPARQEHLIVRAFGHSASLVRAAAATLTGQMQLSPLAPYLAAGLQDPNEAVARACAVGLGRLGASAWPILQDELLAGRPRAPLALEALELAQTGRLTTVAL